MRELLSYNEIVGLFAELWFLQSWLLPQIDKLDAITHWRGPFLSRHDFEWSERSIEVKATTNAESRVHRIHGIEQLSPINEKLFLFSLRLREEQSSNFTLPNIIESCRAEIKDNTEASSKFENILAIAGYSSAYDEEYSKLKFRIVDEKLYEVTDSFPHLTKNSFIEGVSNGISMIEYTINLDGYDHLCIAKSPDEIKDILI